MNPKAKPQKIENTAAKYADMEAVANAYKASNEFDKGYLTGYMSKMIREQGQQKRTQPA